MSGGEQRPVPLVAQAETKPDQVGILVPSLERAFPAYGPARTWRIWEYGPQVLSEQVLDGEPARFSMRLALSGTDPEVELVEPRQGPSAYHRWVDEYGYGLHHLGYLVDDVRAVIDEMEAAGCPLLQAGFGFGADGSGGFAYFDTRETLGIIVEAIERPAERRPPEALWPPDEAAEG
ncbi:MAG: VOC family protein [Solirubrobacterales bacterium]